MANKMMKLLGQTVCSVFALTLVLIGCGKANQLGMQSAEHRRAEAIAVAKKMSQQEKLKCSKRSRKSTNRVSVPVNKSMRKGHFMKAACVGSLLLATGMIHNITSMSSGTSSDLLINNGSLPFMNPWDHNVTSNENYKIEKILFTSEDKTRKNPSG